MNRGACFTLFVMMSVLALSCTDTITNLVNSKITDDLVKAQAHSE